MQLHLPDGAFHPEQHPIVDIAGIVDAIGVDQ
jgi:hypothetical protein